MTAHRDEVPPGRHGVITSSAAVVPRYVPWSFPPSRDSLKHGQIGPARNEYRSQRKSCREAHHGAGLRHRLADPRVDEHLVKCQPGFLTNPVLAPDARSEAWRSSAVRADEHKKIDSSPRPDSERPLRVVTGHPAAGPR